MSILQAVRGTRDLLPPETELWNHIDTTARRVFERYSFGEIRTPVLEDTQLFARGVGEETDIVSKEMYTFTPDAESAQSLTLRPENTAGVVRAYIEHQLGETGQLQKLYYIGPQFRRERPQKGRYRQFHQVDVEAFGLTRPAIDAEMVEMALGYLEACGLKSYELVLNSVGDAKCRPAYVETLRAALRPQASRLCPDCQRRTETNPLRVLDCKVPEDQPVIEALPRIADHLCAECRDHFAEVTRELGLLGIPYRLNHRLVRGLDYYTRTTFEVTSDALGAQNSVLGGGRYDGLVSALGGPDISGIGFALGMERLVLILPVPEAQPRCDVFLMPLEDAALDETLRLQRALRGAGLRVLMDPEGRSFKARLRLADKLGARYVAIRGEDERRKGVWSVRDMKGSAQEDVAESRVAEHLTERIHG
jgi:histidyl-tRNA synthetase